MRFTVQVDDTVKARRGGPLSWSWDTRAMRNVALLSAFALLSARLLAGADLSVCEAYGAADAVFIGEAGSPVLHTFTQRDGPALESMFSPVTVERAFRGVSTPVAFILPVGVTTYLVPGQRYLIYGRHYADPDVFMSGEVYGTKLIDHATEDLQFLNAAAASPSGAVVSGILELDESDSAHIGRDVVPLPNVAVRLSVKDVEGATPKDLTASTRTAAGGYFQVSGLPSAIYRADADLPDDLIMADHPPPQIRVLVGGCSSLRLRVVPNGHVRGVLRTTDGPSTGFETISLLPAELQAGEPDRYFQQVTVDHQGRFAFDAVRPGRYLLGRLTRNLNGVPVRAVYYPGTPDRTAATVIVVGRSSTADVGDFWVPLLK